MISYRDADQRRYHCPSCAEMGSLKKITIQSSPEANSNSFFLCAKCSLELADQINTFTDDIKSEAASGAHLNTEIEE